MTPFDRLHPRPLQLWLRSVYSPVKHQGSKTVIIPSCILRELSWWLHPNLKKGVAFKTLLPSGMIVMDPSGTGWGAHFDYLQIQGTWSPEAMRLHIGVLDLQAIRLAYMTLLLVLWHMIVQVLIDNTKRCLFIPLCRETIKLWNWCCTLIAVHLLGTRNS